MFSTCCDTNTCTRQKKEEIDKDKTPVPDKKQSTISRLESKYSDVLGRRRRKEQQQREQEDRDKTLEPDKAGFATPLARSATTILSPSSSGGSSASSTGPPKKERTPYRLHRNYSDRKPTTSSLASAGGSASSSSSSSSSGYKSRPDLSLLQHSATSSSIAVPKSSYYESPIMRHKDSLYDAYSSRVPASSRYNDYDHYPLSSSGGSTSSSGHTHGYYEGRDKENTFKSKYDPGRLYAELTNEKFAGDRNISRYPKSYRRTATTNFSNYDDDLHHNLTTPSTAGSYSGRNVTSSSRYAPRKSTGYQRSQTQKFFDSENSSVLRSLNDANNNTIDLYGGNGFADEDAIKSEAVKEREARRKEIQGLIAKYAQIDDVYHRAIDNEAPAQSTAPLSQAAHRTSITADYNDPNNNHLSSVLFHGKTADLLASQNEAAAAALGLSYPYAQTSSKTSFLPLSKTQSVSSMSSMNRSRIPKTYTSFVRARKVLFLFSVFAVLKFTHFLYFMTNPRLKPYYLHSVHLSKPENNFNQETACDFFFVSVQFFKQ